MGQAAPHSVPLPHPLRRDLGEREEVLAVAPGRLIPRPDAERGLPVVAVLTIERLVLVPGAEGSPPARTARTSDPLGELLSDVMRSVGTSVVELLLGRRSSGQGEALAGRARPGIEVPLGLARSLFVARVPAVLGVELALPPRDPRPPFALYVDLRSRGVAAHWCDLAEGHRRQAPPRPELERPYSLYYLWRELPKPVVRLYGPGHRRRGVLRLGLDGPVLGGTQRELLGPYEGIERVQWAAPSPTRRAAMVITAGEREWLLEPARGKDRRPLEDVAQLVAELAGRPVETTAGHLRAGRLAVTGAGAAGVAAALYELLSGL